MINIFHGNVVYSKSKEELASFEHHYIIVEDGVVVDVCPVIPEAYAKVPVTEFGDDVIIPAFSDLHVHAPQYPQRGTAMDPLLYDWLHQYTFPLEAKYADIRCARQVYDAFVDDLIEHGTSSMHPDDRERWHAMFCRENQLRLYREGKKEFHMITRQIGDDGVYRKVETSNYFVKSPASEDVLVISLCNNIGE